MSFFSLSSNPWLSPRLPLVGFPHVPQKLSCLTEAAWHVRGRAPTIAAQPAARFSLGGALLRPIAHPPARRSRMGEGRRVRRRRRADRRGHRFLYRDGAERRPLPHERARGALRRSRVSARKSFRRRQSIAPPDASASRPKFPPKVLWHGVREGDNLSRQDGIGLGVLRTRKRAGRALGGRRPLALWQCRRFLLPIRFRPRGGQAPWRAAPGWSARGCPKQPLPRPQLAQARRSP